MQAVAYLPYKTPPLQIFDQIPQTTEIDMIFAKACIFSLFLIIHVNGTSGKYTLYI